MSLVDALPVPTSPENASRAAEQEILVDFQEFLFPEVFFIEYVCAEYLGRHSSGQIFQSFTGEAPFDCSVVL